MESNNTLTTFFPCQFKRGSKVNLTGRKKGFGTIKSCKLMMVNDDLFASITWAISVRQRNRQFVVSRYLLKAFKLENER